MSYDLMVFEKSNVPKSKAEFMEWFQVQTQWSEEHDYQSVSVASPSLRNWFLEMKDTFPPMNGEFSPDVNLLDEDEDLERHTTDYSIGREVIYAAFSWSLVDESYALTTKLAKKHDVGFFDVSSEDGTVILPDGTEMI